jgi:hypothetical protein
VNIICFLVIATMAEDAARNKLLDDLSKPQQLKPTETQDKSAPQIEKDVVIKEAPHKKVFEEIKQTHELNHVETADKSAPVIEKDVKIGENPMKSVLAEVPAGKAILVHNKLIKDISTPHELKHVETTDKSAPVIDRMYSFL